MSGIAGIYNVDGRPVEVSEIEVMLETMAHRGPDGRGQWINKRIAFGHCLLHTTPESLFEHLPLSLNDITITANTRLDNRDALFNALGIKDVNRAEMSDPELIIHAYLRWGVDCAQHLIGDFAFALWDEPQKRLYCARDQMGLKPFYYCRLGERFIFASEMQAIIPMLPNPPRVCEEVIIKHIIQDYTDKSSTYLEHIYRLPPANFLICDTQGNITLHEYWRLDPDREIRINSFADYVEQFRELFFEAVRCRLRSAFPVGSALSGGLDSSSISCVARDLQRETIPNFRALPVSSAYSPKFPQLDERQYQDAVVSSGGFEPHFFSVDQTGPFIDSHERATLTGEPIFRPNEYTLWMTLQTAQQQSIRVLLHGYDGDSTVSNGDAIFQEWTVNRDWTEIQQQIDHIAHILNSPASWIASFPMKNWVLPTLEELSQQGDRFGALQRLIKLRTFLPHSKATLVKTVLGVLFPKTYSNWLSVRRNGKFPTHYQDIFNEDVIRHYHLNSQALPLDPTAHILMTRLYHYKLLTASYLMTNLEINELLSARYGMDMRSPFSDIRLIEFNLAAPVKYKMHLGWTRSGLREAMKGILPEKVRTRLDKGLYGEIFHYVLHEHNAKEIDVIRQGIKQLMPFINVDQFNRALNEYLQNGRAEHNAYMWPILATSFWLHDMGYEVIRK